MAKLGKRKRPGGRSTPKLRTVDDVIADVRLMMKGRTYYRSQQPFSDELLVAEIDHLRNKAKDAERLRTALRQFADPKNWSQKPGRLQWIGKRHAVEFAASFLK